MSKWKSFRLRAAMFFAWRICGVPLELHQEYLHPDYTTTWANNMRRMRQKAA